MAKPIKKYIITTPELTAAREALKVATEQAKAKIAKLKGNKQNG